MGALKQEAADAPVAALAVPEVASVAPLVHPRGPLAGPLAAAVVAVAVQRQVLSVAAVAAASADVSRSVRSVKSLSSRMHRRLAA